MGFQEDLDLLVADKNIKFKNKKHKTDFIENVKEAFEKATQPKDIKKAAPVVKPPKKREGVSEIVKNAKPVGHAVMTPGLSQKADDLVRAKYGLG